MFNVVFPFADFVVACMALVDSKAEFEKRVNELGLQQALTKMHEIGIHTLADLAYATDFVPGTSLAEVFTKEVVIPILGDAASTKKIPLRRLFVEAFALAVADLHRKTEPRTDDVVEKLPATER